MSKKIVTFSIAILIFAVSLVTASYDKAILGTDLKYAYADTHAVGETASTTESLGEFVSNKVDSVTNLGGIIGDVSDIGNSLGGMLGGLGGTSTGGIGDALGGIGDALGGIMGGMNDGGSSGSSSGTGSVTYDVNTETIGYIDIVPAASDFTPVITTSASVPATEVVVNETVDFAATANPYTKPTGELKGGDKGDGVKWMQWIFIYTRYGLKDNGITGVFDEDTMAVVKKLQKENGLSVDGIVDDEVIDKIELLYFQATYTTTAPANLTEPTTQVVTTDDSNSQNDKGKSATSIVLIVLVIVLIWMLAVGAVVLLVILKKKKGGKKKSAKKEKSIVEDSTVIESISVEDGNSTIAEMFDKLD